MEIWWVGDETVNRTIAKDKNLGDAYSTGQANLVSDQQQYFDLSNVTKHVGRFLLFSDLLLYEDYMGFTV